MPYKSLYRGVKAAEEDAVHLAKLSDAARDILAREGSYEDIADQMGIPLGTVRSRLHRARAALTKMREAV